MNNNKIKLKIGEFSKLNFVTVKTLRHYEEIGLLIPNEVDEWTGYRYYDVCQFQKMAKIIFLKRLGFSLEQIKEMFDDGDTEPNIKEVQMKIAETRQSQELLKWRLEELSKMEKHLITSKAMENITVISLPEIIVASHRRVIANYAELFNLCPNIIGPEMQRLGCVCAEPGYCFTVEHNKEYRESDIDIEYCEAVTEMKQDSDLIKFKTLPAVPKAVCISHFGPYELLPQSFAKMYKYIEENGYKIADFPRFCYIDGIWNCESEKDWRTDIQVPVC